MSAIARWHYVGRKTSMILKPRNFVMPWLCPWSAKRQSTGAWS